MVKPPLRAKSIGFKVSEEEYAQLETAAQADGRTLGEWCREAILRGGSANDAARHDPGAGEGRTELLRLPGCSESFSLAVGWVLAAPICSAALPSSPAIHSLNPGCSGLPMRAVIRV